MPTPRMFLLLALLTTAGATISSGRPLDAGEATKWQAGPADDWRPEAAPPIDTPSPSSRATRTFGSYRLINGQPYAILDKTWTFDHGHGETAEGWRASASGSGLGSAWKRIADPEWTTRNPTHGGPAPTITGSGSAWVGMYEDSAAALCWINGPGYGNEWSQNFFSPELTHDGTGDVAISFDYWCDLEDGYDYLRVYLETYPSETETELVAFTGVLSTDTYSGVIAEADFGGETSFRLVFRLESDAAYSDEDGSYVTIEGPFAFDDLILTGNIVEGDQSWDFETDQGGFTVSPPGTADLLSVHDVAYYDVHFAGQSPQPSDCPDLSGNVLASHDASYEHPQGTYVYAVSPIVDLTGITGIEDLRAEWDIYSLLPLEDGVFFRVGWTYYPYTCDDPPHAETWSARVGGGWMYSGTDPSCSPGSASAMAYVPLPPSSEPAEKVRLVIEVMADCAGIGGCTGLNSNASPLFDNIAVVVEGASLSIPGDGACCLPYGACHQVREVTCDTYGGTWSAGGTCSPSSPCDVPVEAVPSAGGLLNPEPWHDWISDYDTAEGIPLQAHIPDHIGEIDYVEFYYSTDGGTTWEFIAQDTSGYEPPLDTWDTGVTMIGCGWSTFFDVPDTVDSGEMQVKTVAYPVSGGPFEDVVSHMYDKQPPSMGRVNIDDFAIVDRDALGIEVYAVDGGEIDRIIIHRQEMQQDYSKAVPGICQLPHSDTHCAPTAAAQCLKYFEDVGDATVAAGLDDYHLTGALAAYMSTNQNLAGTLPSNWVGGLSEWLGEYNPDYKVEYFVHYTCEGGCTNWTEEEDWTRIRNELEMCHDVLVGVFWDGGGGHALTLNAILHPPLPDGSYLVGYKDPWTGASESGQLDPATGHFTNMTGAGGGGGGQIGVSMIVTPAEGAIEEGGPGDPIYDGLPAGDPPYAIEVPIPDYGYWFFYITVVNPEGHAHQITRIVQYQDPAGTGEDRPPLLATYLRPARPNPFHERSELAFAVPRSSEVRIAVFDVTGRMVRTLVDGRVDPGIHKVFWDGRDNGERRVGSGIYYVKMQTENFEKARRIVLIH